MSAEALSPDRIEGEFYYARKVQGDVVFESWMIFHRGDDEEASDYYWRGMDARHIIEALDAALTTEHDRILGLIERHMEDPKEPEGWATLNYLTTKLRKETETDD